MSNPWFDMSFMFEEIDRRFINSFHVEAKRKEDAKNLWSACPTEDAFEEYLVPGGINILSRSPIRIYRPGDLLRQVGRDRCVQATLLVKLEKFSEWTLSDYIEYKHEVETLVLVNREAEVEVNKLLAGIDYFFRPFVAPVLIPTEADMEKYAPQLHKKTRIFQIDGFRDDNWGPSILIPLIRWFQLMKKST